VTRESQTWRDVWAALKPQLGSIKLPAVVVVHDNRGDVFPIDSEDQLLALLQTYGGN
jgi:hypothetical protein